MKSRAIVTGPNGFIGSNLVRALLSKNYDVTCLIRKTSNLESIKNLPVRFAYGDCNDIESLRKACEGKDYVFHLAAKVKEKSKKKYFEVNLNGTKNLLTAIKDFKVKKFVFLSSQAAAGPSENKIPKTEEESENPISYYGKSKLAAEEYVRKYAKIPWTIIRPSSVFGPYDKDFYIYFKLVKRGFAPLVGFGEKFISLVYIEDLTNLIIKAAEKPEANQQTFFACDGNIYSWNDFIEILKNVMKKKAITLKVPMSFAYATALFNECTKYLHKKQAILNLQKVKEMKIKYWLCSSEKARKLLNFSAKFSLDEALQKTYNWYKENKWL
ncbi:MAG: NAD(P)-dependent oxidoreductase [Candidatus Cloacimonadota bacterium]|nr:NAD(P)-dependent oxidoreductase [Candidatus Cloacimonadota bacterium]